jgi:hypothetical protein
MVMIFLAGVAIRSGRLAAHVEPDGDQDDDALDDELVEVGHRQHVHAVVDDPDDQRAEDGADHGADAAGERGSAEHHGGDGVQLVAHAGIGLRRG